jgi:hypothetical protein
MSKRLRLPSWATDPVAWLPWLAGLGFLLLLIRKMITFSPAVEAKLDTLRPVTRWRVRAWLILVYVELGLEPVIVSAARNATEQHLLHLADHRNPDPVAGKPDSHMSKRAVDMNFKKDGKTYLLKGSPVADWQPVYDLALTCGLTLGHFFKGYDDRNHFQDNNFL